MNVFIKADPWDCGLWDSIPHISTWSTWSVLRLLRHTQGWQISGIYSWSRPFGEAARGQAQHQGVSWMVPGGYLAKSVQSWLWNRTTCIDKSSSSLSVCMGLSPGQYKNLVVFPQNLLKPYCSENHPSAFQGNGHILAAVILWFMCLPLNTTISIPCVICVTQVLPR